MWQTYYTPTSVEETLRLLAKHGPEARIIAGGTDLLVELRRDARQAPVLIDVTRISNLDRVRLDESRRWRLYALGRRERRRVGRSPLGPRGRQLSLRDRSRLPRYTR